ncbi:MAG: cadmium resistance transporter [Lactobacillaceae bacterium]|jgi:cadmium resistance transport/sequestration family protein|nr:cadmium resistance transporter [Lactobacillaceae bacterium]
MLQAIIQGLLSYIGTTSDYFVVLLVVFGCYNVKQRNSIFIGSYIGNGLLILASILVAFFAQQVPQEWLLGLLGIVPIVMGIRALLVDEDETENIGDQFQNNNNIKIITNVIIITITTCGADNLAIYIPYFSNIDFAFIPIILAMFILILTVVNYAAYRFSTIKPVHEFCERFSDKIQFVVYVALGVYILFDTGAVQHILQLITG